MDMSFSYQPVLLKAMFEHVGESGRVCVENIVDYFISFYGDRKEKGFFVEKKSSIFCRDGFSRKDTERNILANPFKRFEDMRFMKRCREIEFVEFNRYVFKKLAKAGAVVNKVPSMSEQHTISAEIITLSYATLVKCWILLLIFLLMDICFVLCLPAFSIDGNH